MFATMKQFKFVEENGREVFFSFYRYELDLYVYLILAENDGGECGWNEKMTDLPYNIRISNECKQYIERVARNLAFS